MTDSVTSHFQLLERFPDDDTAERWFVETRWKSGAACPACGSCNVQERPTRKPQPYRCRDCRKDFSVKTGTLMHNSKLGYRVWAVSIYLLSTQPKGVASTRLAEALGITPKTAWHLLHRIRESWEDNRELLAGPVKADEAYIGGLERFKHADKRLRQGGAGGGKTIVAGVRNQATGEVRAKVVPAASRAVLQPFVSHHVEPGARLYTDEPSAYEGAPFEHFSCNHGKGGEDVSKDGATTNGVESLWPLLKRGYKGIYHKMSPQNLHRYLREFSGRLNHNDLPVLERMAVVAAGLDGKRLTYRTLTDANGLPSGARSA